MVPLLLLLPLLWGGDPHYSDAVATNDRKKRVKSETQGRFHLLGDPRDNDCSLSIQEARLSDSGVYYLRVERGRYVKYSYREKKLNLQVTEKPDIQFLEPLESGRRTPLTCSLSLVCDGPQILLFSWAGDTLDAMNPDTLHSSELTLTPRFQDHGTNLTCLVTLHGTQVTLERTVQLNVSYAPRNLRISLSFRNSTALKILQNASSVLISEGQALQLLCVADSNPPAQLSWFWGSPALESTPISSTGVLEIPQAAAGDGEVTCQAQNPLGSQQVFFSLSVQKGPPPCSSETEEQQGSWPLVLTLIRGALMGAGFLLTYGFTWTYYTRTFGVFQLQPRLWSPPSPSSPANLHHLLPSWLPVGASSFLPHIRGTSSLMEAPGPGLEDADVVPLLLHPETLHSLKLAPTPRRQDHSTDLTCRVNLQGSQMPRGTAASASPSETAQGLF
ncbi:sialic acid-binding Ig-like lectin 14 isoform X11 [Ovis canadensis]|uniref:sialic acid-binding Ig-like lectin 14 isoform X11 n=1 Tax=Ovis canadensis TaxID=37174 RepID=UPI003750A3F0